MNAVNDAPLSLSIYSFLWSINPTVICWNARNDYFVFQYAFSTARRYLRTITGKRILDLGCGDLFPVTLLFHSLNMCSVTGIDVRPLVSCMRLSLRINDINQNFVSRKIKSFYTRHVYYRELQNMALFPLKFQGLDLQQMDARKMSFEDSTFDFVTSNAAFEHINNIGEVVSEMHRVMKKGAFARIVIHLFPSLTGGHTVPFSTIGTDFVALGGMRPWDHLRGGHIPRDLNCLREKDYRHLFKDFKILEWRTQCVEPRRFLSNSVKSELKAFSSEELLKRAIVIVLQN